MPLRANKRKLTNINRTTRLRQRETLSACYDRTTKYSQAGAGGCVIYECVFRFRGFDLVHSASLFQFIYTSSHISDSVAIYVIFIDSIVVLSFVDSCVAYFSRIVFSASSILTVMFM